MKLSRTAALVAGICLLLCAGGVTPRPAEQADLTDIASDATILTKATFSNPPPRDRPWARWNLPDGVTDAELRKELQDIYGAGISGVEIGQGVYPPTDQIGLILKTANALGITVSFLGGPINAPADFSIDDDNARKSLAFTQLHVASGETFTGRLPVPAESIRRSLIAVQAYRCLGTCTTTAPNVLEWDSRISLTMKVMPSRNDGIANAISDAHLIWSPPALGQWVVIAFWSVGYLPQPDLLTKRGTEILTSSIQNHFALHHQQLRKNGGDFFFDSHSSSRGNPVDSWSNTMEAEFLERAGYSIIPYLPMIVRYPTTGLKPAPHAFEFDAGTSAKVRNDFYQIRTDLWLEHHVQPLKRWAARLNYHIRIQPYGDNIESIDSIQAAAALEKPETETLWFGDMVDNYIPIASANHMTRNKWYSIEGSAVVNGAYAQTFQDQVIHLNKAYAGGVTKLVYHIYPYAKSASAVWPGFSTFPNTFGNSWGPRSPMWIDASEYNDYFARTQQVLTQGNGKVDVAVYMQNYLWPQPYTLGGLQYWSDQGLARAGYTRDYLNPTLLSLPNAIVANGHLAPNGPAYKALIIDSTQMPVSAASRTTMPLATARRLLEFGTAGLPIVIVGQPPADVPGLAGQEAKIELQSTFAQLLALPNTHLVESEAAVPALLGKIGVQPAAMPDQLGPVLSVHRQDTDTDFYWFYNQNDVAIASEPATLFEPAAGSPVDRVYALEGHGEPYLLNAWDGSITPIEVYSKTPDRITVKVRLSKEGSQIIALSKNASRFGHSKGAVHVTATTADNIEVRADGAVFPTAYHSGSYRTVLSDGRVVVSDIAASPESLDLSNQQWELEVEDWRPANFSARGDEADASATTSVKLMIQRLRPWRETAALENVSGIGRYSTTFVLPSSWSSNNGAVLSLGEVFDSFVVSVNGKPAGFTDQLSGDLDVSALLRAGTNTLSIRVATNLNNRLRTLDMTIGQRPAQAYGLLGPVFLHPYTRAARELYRHRNADEWKGKAPSCRYGCPTGTAR